MSYKIVIDSCGELTEEMKASAIYESVAVSYTHLCAEISGCYYPASGLL